ncbi:hypothetical protein BDK51DRAFT_29819 [Blyttiomyces helicus]|uniref:Uncharacterized protein n=2 Tax=Blyttiomyces helicus TaxID=388810 RepID=A0A4P9WEA1_9FUNG|nr:hypothetical protein BDK51DRAFT_29819 [Blyttiomyces helicus]|eukprot:RKO88706.1 hypothetical protein BDK51DRAFT_29819 [Blyttiomyces helicus]
MPTEEEIVTTEEEIQRRIDAAVDAAVTAAVTAAVDAATTKLRLELAEKTEECTTKDKNMQIMLVKLWRKKIFTDFILISRPRVFSAGIALGHEGDGGKRRLISFHRPLEKRNTASIQSIVTPKMPTEEEIVTTEEEIQRRIDAAVDAAVTAAVTAAVDAATTKLRLELAEKTEECTTKDKNMQIMLVKLWRKKIFTDFILISRPRVFSAGIALGHEVAKTVPHVQRYGKDPTQVQKFDQNDANNPQAPITPNQT